MRDVITKAKLEAMNIDQELTLTAGMILTEAAKKWIREQGITIRFDGGEEPFPFEEEHSPSRQRQERSHQRVIVTVLGLDKVGIIAAVTSLLAGYGVNILDISQTVMQDFFVMNMVADLSDCRTSFEKLRDALESLGEQMELKITLQHEDIFRYMHRV